MFLTIITFAIILTVLVFVHELGHFWTARKSGIGVEEFGIGLPPRVVGMCKINGKRQWIWGSKNINYEKNKVTIYSLNWLPIGGFVKLVGENDGDIGPDSFSASPLGKRALTLSAGVIMNVLFTIVAMAAVFMIGIPQIIDENDQNLTQYRDVRVTISQVVEASPAKQAGLEIGDDIISINGTNVENVEDVQTYIAEHKNQSMAFTIERGKTRQNLDITPAHIEEFDITGIGVGLVRTGVVSAPPHEAVWKGITATVFLTGELFRALGDIIVSLVSSGVIEQELAGPVGIAVITGQVIDLGFVHVLQFAALLSINLAIINILPFPALDGGRLLFIIIEKFRGKAVSKKIENTAHTVGFALLILLILVVTYNDISQFGDRILTAVKNIF